MACLATRISLGTSPTITTLVTQLGLTRLWLTSRPKRPDSVVASMLEVKLLFFSLYMNFYWLTNTAFPCAWNNTCSSPCLRQESIWSPDLSLFQYLRAPLRTLPRSLPCRNSSQPKGKSYSQYIPSSAHLDSTAFVLNWCNFNTMLRVVRHVQIGHDVLHLGLHYFCLGFPFAPPDGEILRHLVTGVCCLQKLASLAATWWCLSWLRRPTTLNCGLSIREIKN